MSPAPPLPLLSMAVLLISGVSLSAAYITELFWLNKAAINFALSSDAAPKIRLRDTA